jgi:hypothetical protein
MAGEFDRRRSKVRRRPIGLTPGQQVVTVYFAVTYLIPLVGNEFFSDRIISTYRIYPLTIPATLSIIAAYLLFLLISTTKILPSFGWSPSSLTATILNRIAAAYERWRGSIALVLLGVEVAYFYAGLNTYRYSETGISEISSTPRLILLFMGTIGNVIITVDLFQSMFARETESLTIKSKRYWQNILLAFVLVLSANGTATMGLAMTTLFYAVSPRRFRRLVFLPRGLSIVARIRRSVVLVVALVLAFFAAYFCGETIKITASGDKSLGESAESVVERISEEDFFERYTYWVIERFSIYYYSFLLTSNESPEYLNNGTSTVLVYPIDTLLFRLDFLTGRFFDVPRPPLTSLRQLNYQLLTFTEFREREGSSPGLLASFDYVFPLPLNIVFAALYVAWFSYLIDNLLRYRREKLSWVGVILSLAFLQTFFQSPFDFLAGFDESVVFFLLIVVLCGHYSQSFRASVSRSSSILPASIRTGVA